MKDSIKKHKKDIDFRSHEQRRKEAVPDMIEWYKDLTAVLTGKTKLKSEQFNRDFIDGQKVMLSSVLWLLLDPKEYKALSQGKVYIDESTLADDERLLYKSMQAFNGSPYCIKDSIESVIKSYSKRLTSEHKLDTKAILKENSELAEKIATNIVAGALA